MDPLTRAVGMTVSYFSCFQVPLTAFEVWRNIVWDTGELAPTLGVVEEELRRLVAAGTLRATGHGFYGLPDAPDTSHRLMAEADAVAKWRIVRRGTRLLSAIPFVEGVAVVNTLSMGAAHPESDIDVLIVARPGRIFLVRLLSVLVTSLFGLRRHGAQITNRLCLSFFLTSDGFDLTVLAKQPHDPYLRFWASTLIVFLNRNGTFDRFRQANASWLAVFPHAAMRGQVREPMTSMPGRLVRLTERLLSGSWGDVMEQGARALQMRLFRRNVGSRQGEPSTDVVITNAMLKFHENDRRVAIREAWYDRLRGLGIAPEGVEV